MKKSLLLLFLLLSACQQEQKPESPPPEKTAEQAPAPAPTPQSFVGLPLKEAETRAEQADLPHRVISQDGQEFPVTRDYRPERLNFTVENGIVTKVTNG